MRKIYSSTYRVGLDELPSSVDCAVTYSWSPLVFEFSRVYRRGFDLYVIACLVMWLLILRARLGNFEQSLIEHADGKGVSHAFCITRQAVFRHHADCAAFAVTN